MSLAAAEGGTERGNQEHEHGTEDSGFFYISVSQPFLSVLKAKWLTATLRLVAGAAGIPIRVPMKREPV